MLDVAKGSAAQLTADPFDEGSPAWSADGRTIAFVSNRTGAEALWTVSTTGGPAAELPGVAGITRLRWRPAASPELRPDLEQQAPSELALKTETTGDRKRFLLGFRSATDNVGEGPLSVFAFRQSPVVPTMRAVAARPAGRRRISHLPASRLPALHVLGVPRPLAPAGVPALRAAARGRPSPHRPRPQVRVLPHRPLGKRRPGLRRAGRPRPVYTDYCERSNTGALIVSQGTSVGYSDVYPAHFHGQNLDVTRVPAGIYVLVHRASPNLLIRELRYENNAASLRIRLSWPQGRSKEPAVRVLARCPATERCPA